MNCTVKLLNAIAPDWIPIRAHLKDLTSFIDCVCACSQQCDIVGEVASCLTIIEKKVLFEHNKTHL